MTPVLLDAGPIVALLDQSDHNHTRCSSALSDLESPLITCEAVLAEACHLLRRVKNGRGRVLENVERGVFLVPYQLPPRAAHVRNLMRKYANVGMDLADACLVDMAAVLQAGRIFTVDSDFEIYRWGRKRPFDLVLEP